MTRQNPTITMEISEILDESDEGIRVVRKQTGAPLWLPKEELAFRPGVVVLPVWLAKKIMRRREANGIQNKVPIDGSRMARGS